MGLIVHVIISMAILSMPAMKPSWKSLTVIWHVPACSPTYSAILRPRVRPGFCITSYSHPGLSGHVVPGISDHDAVLLEVNMSPRCPPKPPRKILQYHKADFDGLRSHLFSFVTTFHHFRWLNRHPLRPLTFGPAPALAVC